MAWESLQIASDDVADDREGSANGHSSESTETQAPEKAVSTSLPISAVKKDKGVSWSPAQPSLSGLCSVGSILLILCSLFLIAVLSTNLYSHTAHTAWSHIHLTSHLMQRYLSPSALPLVSLRYYVVDVDHWVRNHLTGSSTTSTTSSSTATVTCDVSVIGAGPGGVWTAMRLQQNSPSSKVCLFESESEVGGRLKTRWFDGAPTSALDLGGMRFYQRHRMVYSLVQQYALSFYSPVYDPRNFDFLRGRVVTPTSWSQGTSPYLFTASEQAVLNATAGSGPSTLSQPIVNTLGLNKSSTALWTSCDWNIWTANTVYGTGNAKVYDQGWWYTLQQVNHTDTRIHGHAEQSTTHHASSPRDE